MRTRMLVAPALIAALLLPAGSPASAGPAAVGRRAPAFELESLSGDPVASRRFSGRPLYVNVFATWCPPCRSEMPLIVRTLRRYAGRVSFLAVDAQESGAVIKPYLAQVGVRSQVAIDRGQFAATYGAKAIPESVFIDRYGTVRAIVHGPINERTLRKYLTLIAYYARPGS